MVSQNNRTTLENQINYQFKHHPISNECYILLTHSGFFISFDNPNDTFVFSLEISRHI